MRPNGARRTKSSDVGSSMKSLMFTFSHECGTKMPFIELRLRVSYIWIAPHVPSKTSRHDHHAHIQVLRNRLPFCRGLRNNCTIVTMCESVFSAMIRFQSWVDSEQKPNNCSYPFTSPLYFHTLQFPFLHERTVPCRDLCLTNQFSIAPVAKAALEKVHPYLGPKM